MDLADHFHYDVFLSYSSEDKQVVHALAKRLQEDGLQVWFDIWTIKIGNVIPHKVQDGLQRSRKIIQFVSRNGLGSAWASVERYAILFDDPLNENGRFIPIRLDDADIPSALRHYKYLDWRNPTEDTYAELLESCRPAMSTGRVEAVPLPQSSDSIDRSNQARPAAPGPAPGDAQEPLAGTPGAPAVHRPQPAPREMGEGRSSASVPWTGSAPSPVRIPPSKRWTRWATMSILVVPLLAVLWLDPWRFRSPGPAKDEPPSETTEPKPIATGDDAGEPKPVPGEDRFHEVKSLGMTLVKIEPGEFNMGLTDDQLKQLNSLYLDKKPPGDIKGEQPEHRVRITRPFYLGVHEVTVGQFRRFVEAANYRTEAERDGKGGIGWHGGQGCMVQDKNFTWKWPGFHQNDDEPVVLVSWNDAQALCEWLNKEEKGPLRLRFRLPTEAEWEFACRAGTTGLFGEGDDPEGLARIGNVLDASVKRISSLSTWTTIRSNDGYVHTSPVGSFPANRWGLHDMIGNVREWCEDGYAAELYSRSARDNPRGPAEAAERVIRGGSWFDELWHCRPAYRFKSAPENRSSDAGIRLAAVKVEG